MLLPPGGSPTYKIVAVRQLSDDLNIRYWPKADISSCTAYVRFRM